MDRLDLDILAEKRINRPVLAACQVRMQMDRRHAKFVLALSRESDGTRYLWWIIVERERPTLRVGPVLYYRGPVGGDVVVHTEKARWGRGYTLEVGMPLHQELLRGTLIGAEAERFAMVLATSELLTEVAQP